MSEKLTWGDVMVAAASASSAVGPDTPISPKRLVGHIRDIIKVIGPARAPRQKGEDDGR